MEQDTQDGHRPANDNRKRLPVDPEKVNTVKPAENKPGLRQRWQKYQPTKTVVVWACVASVVLTIIVGFAWGGWVTGGNSQKAAKTMATDAVIQRLAPICVSQFGLDPDKTQKLVELTDMSSRSRVQYVQDQGWATISGDERPDRRVADACSKLLLETTS